MSPEIVATAVTIIYPAAATATAEVVLENYPSCASVNAALLPFPSVVVVVSAVVFVAATPFVAAVVVIA